MPSYLPWPAAELSAENQDKGPVAFALEGSNLAKLWLKVKQMKRIVEFASFQTSTAFSLNLP